MIHPDNQILLAVKRDDPLIRASALMGANSFMLREINQTQKWYMIPFI